MSEVSDVEIGKLIERVEQLNGSVQALDSRLDSLEKQLERTRGIGIGVVLATVGLSGLGGSLLSKWLSG
jgi:predicted nuclease with TOPRIM domain